MDQAHAEMGGHPSTGRWISRFICGGLVSSTAVPAVVGYQLERYPSALGWSLLAAVLLQTTCFIVVVAMPRLETTDGQQQRPARADEKAGPVAVVAAATVSSTEGVQLSQIQAQPRTESGNV